MITKDDTLKSEQVLSYLKKGDVKSLQHSVDVLNTRGESFSSGLTQKLNREMFNIFELLVVALKSESLDSENNGTWEDNYERKSLLRVLENRYLPNFIFSRDSEVTRDMAHFAKLPDSWDFSASEYAEIFLLIAHSELRVYYQIDNSVYDFFNRETSPFNLFAVALNLSAHDKERFLHYVRTFNDLGRTSVILSKEELLSYVEEFEFLRTGERINSSQANFRFHSLLDRKQKDDAEKFVVHIASSVRMLFTEKYTVDIPVDLFLSINFSRVNKEEENEYSAVRKFLIDAIASSRIIENNE